MVCDKTEDLVGWGVGIDQNLGSIFHEKQGIYTPFPETDTEKSTFKLFVPYLLVMKSTLTTTYLTIFTTSLINVQKHHNPSFLSLTPSGKQFEQVSV